MISKFKTSKALFWPKSQGNSNKYGRFGHLFPFRPIPEKQLRKHTIKISLMTHPSLGIAQRKKSFKTKALHYLFVPCLDILHTKNQNFPMSLFWEIKILRFLPYKANPGLRVKLLNKVILQVTWHQSVTKVFSSL